VRTGSRRDLIFMISFVCEESPRTDVMDRGLQSHSLNSAGDEGPFDPFKLDRGRGTTSKLKP